MIFMLYQYTSKTPKGAHKTWKKNVNYVLIVEESNTCRGKSRYSEYNRQFVTTIWYEEEVRSKEKKRISITRGAVIAVIVW